MKNTLPLRAIQAFEAFGRCGSVTAAAVDLGVSVGAVSQQIRKAEEALGLSLLERRGRSVALTSWGRTYHAAISSGFEQIRDAQHIVERARSESALTISCLPSLASKWVAPQLLDWQIGHAGAKVRLIGSEQEPNFSADQVDFRISYGTKVHEFDHYVELFRDWVVPACAPTLVANRPLRRPSDILDFPLLGIEWARDHQSPPSWAEWAHRIGVPHRKASGEVAFSLSSAAIDAAINGRGFVLAQLSMAAEDIMAGRLVVPFDERMQLPAAYFLAWDRVALEKPFGPDLRSWIVSISKRVDAFSANRGWSTAI
ncbi:LysR family transcriptional regulator [Mesorhizobium sp. CU2]|uniref:LysR family transcriptional regulator n=1 Tax=unclassified Mesorhizobium TaxID=325217 RepID=UPI001125B78A|nr:MULTISPECIES: LysR family transcriptional regulator [unclassified Mesorhizobium]TPN88437.1 LysR family transcriptional regulator [Mesorhizobium sp. CU3]TPO15588.1 LysR family transcriptional regulator [Mesorhizobium sp. CU2]